LPGGGTGILAMLAELGSNLFLYTLSLIPYILLQGFVHFAWDRSQVAEYLADRIGAKVSGTDAFVSMNEKSLLEPKVSAVIQRVVLKDNTSAAVGEIRAAIENIPQRELDRIRRQAELEEVRLDATHPPTMLRIKLLRSQKFQPPMLFLTAEEELVLTEELSSLENNLNSRLAEGYLRSIYY
jgi:Zn-dependent protease with chaperone function